MTWKLRKSKVLNGVLQTWEKPFTKIMPWPTACLGSSSNRSKGAKLPCFFMDKIIKQSHLMTTIQTKPSQYFSFAFRVGNSILNHMIFQWFDTHVQTQQIRCFFYTTPSIKKAIRCSDCFEVARQEGLEPPTICFGDKSSANWATDVLIWRPRQDSNLRWVFQLYA